MPSSSLVLRLGAVLSALSSTAFSAKYTLDDAYKGSNFLDGFDFFTGADPTNGFVKYLPKSQATTSNLVRNVNGDTYLGVDFTTPLTVNAPGRNSVRIESKKRYQFGLFIVDLKHMPSSTCGTWPAFWSLGQGDAAMWPKNGEIDIIEGVNRNANNKFVLHTDKNCKVTGTGHTGTAGPTDCSLATGGTAGCDVNAKETSSYGTGFNAAGGGVYAMEWTDKSIKMWFFPRGSIPASIAADKPDTADFGTPTANFEGGNCDFATKFIEHKFIFNTAFCGDWAGNVYGDSGCPQYPNLNSMDSCKRFVAQNPSAFSQSFWLISYFKTFKVAAVSSSSSSASSTQSSTSSSSSASSTHATTTTTSSSSSSSSTASSTSSSSSSSSSSTSSAASSTTSSASSTSSSATSTASSSSSAASSSSTDSSSSSTTSSAASTTSSAASTSSDTSSSSSSASSAASSTTSDVSSSTMASSSDVSSSATSVYETGSTTSTAVDSHETSCTTSTTAAYDTGSTTSTAVDSYETTSSSVDNHETDSTSCTSSTTVAYDNGSTTSTAADSYQTTSSEVENYETSSTSCTSSTTAAYEAGSTTSTADSYETTSSPVDSHESSSIETSCTTSTTPAYEVGSSTADHSAPVYPTASLPGNYSSAPVDTYPTGYSPSSASVQHSYVTKTYTTTYVDVCSTGYTTIHTTHTAVYEVSPAVPTPQEYPAGFTTTVKYCHAGCGAYPTNVTVTVPIVKTVYPTGNVAKPTSGSEYPAVSPSSPSYPGAGQQVPEGGKTPGDKPSTDHNYHIGVPPHLLSNNTVITATHVVTLSVVPVPASEYYASPSKAAYPAGGSPAPAQPYPAPQGTAPGYPHANPGVNATVPYGTGVSPTKTAYQPPASQFTGAAASMKAGGVLGGLVAAGLALFL